MKVLHITTHLNVGGITSYLSYLCTSLKELGVTPSIASAPGEMEAHFKKNQILLYSIPIHTKNILNPKLLISWLKLKKWYQRESWNLIHAHTRVSQCLAHILSGSIHIPYVTTFHGHYTHHVGRKIFPCLGNKTISVSTSVTDDLKKHYSKFSEKMITISHGLNIDYFNAKAITEEQKKEMRQKIGLRDLPTLGIISRLSVEKGHLKLLEIAKQLINQEKQRVQLLIVGEGKQKEEILKKIVQYNLTNSVFILPTQKDPRLALSLIDIYVTYHEGPEGFGLSTLEAMAMRKPVVIAYSQGGMIDFIEDEKDGFIMPSGSPKLMIEKILALLKSPDMRSTMGQHGCEKIKNNFSARRMAEQTLKVYEKVL